MISVEVERSDGDVGIDVPADQPEEVIQVHAPVFGDDGARHEHFQNQIPTDHPRDDLTHRGIGEGVGGTCHRNHRCEFGIAHYGRTAHDARDQEADDHGRSGVESRSLGSDGEDARSDGHGHTHDGQIPPSEVTFEGTPRLACFRNGLLDGFLTEYVHRDPLPPYSRSFRPLSTRGKYRTIPSHWRHLRSMPMTTGSGTKRMP